MTRRFLLPLELEYIDGRQWRLTAGFGFDSEVLGHTVTVPVDFVTDFASIPRILWNLYPPTGSYGKAAVIHDFLYRTGATKTRKLADQTFREAMTVLGVNRFTKAILYSGVRLGGGSSYKGIK